MTSITIKSNFISAVFFKISLYILSNTIVCNLNVYLYKQKSSKISRNRELSWAKILLIALDSYVKSKIRIDDKFELRVNAFTHRIRISEHTLAPNGGYCCYYLRTFFASCVVL